MFVLLCNRVRSIKSHAVSQSTNPSSGSAARASDEESYSYRIGMIHKRRDVAYANAGVRSGAFSTDLIQ